MLWSQAVAEDFDLVPPREAPTDGWGCTVGISEEGRRELRQECRGGLPLESAGQTASHGMRCNVLRTRWGPCSRAPRALKGERPSPPFAYSIVLSNQTSTVRSCHQIDGNRRSSTPRNRWVLSNHGANELHGSA